MRPHASNIAALAAIGPLATALAVAIVAPTGALASTALLVALPVALVTSAAAIWMWTSRSAIRRRHIRGKRQRRLARGRPIDPLIASLRTTIDAVDTPVVATDADGVVQLVNAALLALLRRERDQLIGRPIEDLFTQGELLAMHQHAGRGQPKSGRIRLRQDGTIRTYEVSARPRPDESSAARFGVVLTLRDVSELATAMQLKTDFVANASHELRTPLAAIRGAVDTLAELEGDELAMRDRLTRMIASNAARLEELMNDLLDLTRLESPEGVAHIRAMDPRDLPALLGPMFDAICLERGLEVTFDVPAWLDRIDSDRQLVELVLKNLVDNACKYAYEHTTIRVTMRVLGSPRKRRTLRIEVADRGIGVPIQDQPRIFERFYQVDQSRAGGVRRRGTGLGLAIVKHAVRALGGTIGLESIWKQGSTFWVELPDCVPPDPAAASAQSQPRRSQPAGSEAGTPGELVEGSQALSDPATGRPEPPRPLEAQPDEQRPSR